MADRVVAALVLACALALPGGALASPGDLDPSFNGMGKDSGGGSPLVGVAVQPDGETLVLDDSGATRYDADGKVDNSYGKKGFAAGRAGRVLRVERVGHRGSRRRLEPRGRRLDRQGRRHCDRGRAPARHRKAGHGVRLGGPSGYRCPDQVSVARLALQADGRIAVGAGLPDSRRSPS